LASTNMLKNLSRSKPLRLAFALFLLACGLAAGFCLRSPLGILALALSFSVGYIAGKWHVWRHWRERPCSSVITQLLATFATQVVLVSLLYLVGLGLATVFGKRGLSHFSSADVCFSMIVTLLTLGICVLVQRLEAAEAPQDVFSSTSEQPQPFVTHKHGSDEPDIKILDTVITPISFFRGAYYGHNDAEQRAGGDTKIAVAEARLQQQLPEALRALYRLQNGGSVDGMMIYKAGRPHSSRSEDVIYPFGGYDDLLPLEHLRTLFDFYTDFADPEEEAERFPEGCQQQIVLAAWYRHILLLDYAQDQNEPSVLFADFDDENWRSHAERWPNFASFFARLRHVT
jgi:cell shape-determining protein MreD